MKAAKAKWTLSGNCLEDKGKGGYKGRSAGTARISCVYDPYETGGFTYTTTAYVEDPKLSSAPGDAAHMM